MGNLFSVGLFAEPGRELLQDSLELGAALARLVHPARHHPPPLSKLLRACAHPVVGAIFARRAQVCDIRYVTLIAIRAITNIMTWYNLRGQLGISLSLSSSYYYKINRCSYWR